MKKGFQESKLRMLADPLGRLTLAALEEKELCGLARALAAEDPYRERHHLEEALRLANAAETDLSVVIGHQLWCAWRQARWSTGRIAADEFGATIEVDGAGWIAETEGKPTILIAPMTLCTADAVEAVLHFANRECKLRDVIFYGEDMGGKRGAQFVCGEELSVIRQISRVLANGGVFCTYPDFVYRGRAALPVRIFGTTRPMSSGFAYLAARSGMYLLPCLLLHRGGGIVAQISEPVLLEDASEPGGPSFQALVAQVVADALEDLIRRAPEQWLLLPTLSFDAPEMAPQAPGEARGAA